MKPETLNRISTPAGALFLTLALLAGANASAQTVHYNASATGSKMKMEGTSSIHDWTMESVTIGGSLDVDDKFPESALTDAKAAKPVVAVRVPVRMFKSNSQDMDTRMQKCMNVTQHPQIEYKVIELKPKSAAGATGALQFDAVGAMTISGVTRTNTMPVTIEKKDGKLKIAGKTPIKMSDYGVTPPALSILGLGSITTGDEVQISFEWLAAPKAPPKAP